jgi:hypothetical protein
MWHSFPKVAHQCVVESKQLIIITLPNQAIASTVPTVAKRNCKCKAGTTDLSLDTYQGYTLSHRSNPLIHSLDQSQQMQ